MIIIKASCDACGGAIDVETDSHVSMFGKIFAPEKWPTLKCKDLGQVHLCEDCAKIFLKLINKEALLDESSSDQPVGFSIQIYDDMEDDLSD